MLASQNGIIQNHNKIWAAITILRDECGRWGSDEHNEPGFIASKQNSSITTIDGEAIFRQFCQKYVDLCFFNYIWCYFEHMLTYKSLALDKRPFKTYDSQAE